MKTNKIHLISLLITSSLLCVFPQKISAATLIYSTDFEDVTKISSDELDMGGIDNYFEFGGSGGARMWMEDSKAHSGSKSVGMEVTNINRSRRAEFNLMNMENLVGNEYTMSYWQYFPADYTMAGQGNGNWHEFSVLYQENNSQTGEWCPYAKLTLTQPNLNQQIFDIALDGRRTNCNYITFSRDQDFMLTLGEWFNIRTYLKRHQTNGALKVWINDELILEANNVSTMNEDDYFSTISKLYYETTDSSTYRMWTDDLTIWQGYEPPTGGTSPTPTPSPSPSPSPTPSPSPSPSPETCHDTDINQDGFTNLIDYTILVQHFYENPLTNTRADINQDNTVDIRDYTNLINNFLETSDCAN